MNKSWILSSGLMVWIGLSFHVLAGSLEPPAGPDDEASAMYSIEAIYQRLHDGTPGAKRTGAFRGPTGPPGSTGHDLNEVMAVAPSNVTVAVGATTNEVLSGQIFWGLTTNEWGTHTGSIPTCTLSSNTIVVTAGYYEATTLTNVDADLVTNNIRVDVTLFGVTGTVYEGAVTKTGQTNEYGKTGSDGALQKGVAWPVPRFTSNDQYTVTDNMTGLMWTRNANLPGEELDWTNAIYFCTNTLYTLGEGGGTYGGYSDWRLPNVNELCSLIHRGFIFLALPNTAGTGQWAENDPFTNVQNAWYWVSTTLSGSAGTAWRVYMGDGYSQYTSKTTAYYVWPVRGGL